MKHPFWFINSTLLFLVVFTLGFFYFARVNVPMREDILPNAYTKIKKEQLLQININKIYEHDIFDTYVKQQIPVPEKDQVTPFPEPPRPLPVMVPEIPKPQFLEPLNITLRGIIAVRNNSTQNRAIIADNKTDKDITYKIGDMIEDAQLIRIFNNKVIFLRSNGQQEVLYVREQDALSDPAYIVIEHWETVAQQISPYQYIVSRREILNHITSLAEFIDLIGLTTAYKQGKSIGCRVGLITEKSLGAQLGLQTGDIIVTINEIPANTTENRLKIYKNIVAMEDGDTITIRVIRKKQEYTITYSLREFIKEPNKEPLVESEHHIVPLEKIKQEEKIKILEENHKFAPTIQEIRMREKSNMMNKGKANAAQPKNTDLE